MGEGLASAFVVVELMAQLQEFERAKKRSKKFRDKVDSLEFQEPFINDGVPVVPPAEAIAFFQGKIPLSSKTLEKLVAQARRRGIAAGRDFLKNLRKLLQSELERGLESGISVDKWIREVNELITRIGLDPAQPHQLQTIYRTNLNTARNAAKWRMAQEPAVKEVFKFGIYRTLGNGTPNFNGVRPAHAKLHMKAYLLTDPFWNTWWPPNGFN